MASIELKENDGIKDYLELDDNILKIMKIFIMKKNQYIYYIIYWKMIYVYHMVY